VSGQPYLSALEWVDSPRLAQLYAGHVNASVMISDEGKYRVKVDNPDGLPRRVRARWVEVFAPYVDVPIYPNSELEWPAGSRVLQKGEAVITLRAGETEGYSNDFWVTAPRFAASRGQIRVYPHNPALDIEPVPAVPQTTAGAADAGDVTGAATNHRYPVRDTAILQLSPALAPADAGAVLHRLHLGAGAQFNSYEIPGASATGGRLDLESVKLHAPEGASGLRFFVQEVATAAWTELNFGDELLTPYFEDKAALGQYRFYLQAVAPGQGALQLEVTKGGVTTPSDKLATRTYAMSYLDVDANRDGVIDDNDKGLPTPATPFRFWINDDDDVDTENLDNVEKTTVSRADWDDDKIDGIRDLEDFARLNIYMGGLQDAIVAGTIKVGLKWKNITSGAPAIKVWRNLSPNGGTEYLTDLTVAQQHLALTQPGYVHGTDTYIIPTQFWTANALSATQPNGYMLFEGCGVGKGQLVITIHKADGTEIGEVPGVYMDMKNIKAFYERVKVTPRSPSPMPSPFLQSSQAFPERSTFDASTAGTEPSDDGVPFVAPTKEDKTALVFVHGSNIPYEEARWNAETMFKRLYWQGYKGRFVLFYWDTLVGLWDGEFPAHYNHNEYRAWKYGPALSGYVANGLPSGYAKNVIGHSLGNGLILSALKGYTSPTGTTVAPMTARNVLLMQAAMPASCLDANAPTISELTNLENPQTTPDGAAQKGYRGVVGSGVNATVFNIYNDGDFALGYWTLNQRLTKPESLSAYDRIYTWNASAGGELWLLSQRNIDPQATPLRAVSDAQESMSFVARSRTKAAGRITMGGSVGQNLNIGRNTPVGLQEERYDHSGQFTRSVQQLWPLYEYIYEQAR
jgi:hypothetical protein